MKWGQSEDELLKILYRYEIAESKITFLAITTLFSDGIMSTDIIQTH